MGELLSLRAGDGFELGAYRAAPGGQPRAGLVVIQEVFGVNHHIRDVTDRFAAEGYLAVAPALFDRIERGLELDYTADGIERGRAMARGELDPAQTLLDLEAAARAVSGAGAVGCVGYCWGGYLAARSAIELGGVFTAAVSYYGGLVGTLTGGTPSIPLQLHFGSDDFAIPMTEAEQVRAAWPAAEVHVYGGAGHGFNCDQRDSFEPTVAALALERTLRFLADHL
jgi:carboxymethylenebutenolidase